MIKAIILFALSFNVYALDYIYKGSSDARVSTYFNGFIQDISQDSWKLTAHGNYNCLNKNSSGCRKVGIEIEKGQFNFEAKRNYSFTFKIDKSNIAPEWVIIFQDWARLDPLDANGNHPVTTIKIRRFAGQLYLQHWENSWQFKPWNFEPDDPYDYNHEHGLEVMRGEYKITAGQYYDISFDIHDRGWASLKVDGVRVSDAEYQTMSYTERHINYFGMYWSKDFNIAENYAEDYSVEVLNLKYIVN